MSEGSRCHIEQVSVMSCRLSWAVLPLVEYLDLFLVLLGLEAYSSNLVCRITATPMSKYVCSGFNILS